jgi:hypothetical protein
MSKIKPQELISCVFFESDIGKVRIAALMVFSGFEIKGEEGWIVVYKVSFHCLDVCYVFVRTLVPCLVLRK